METKSKLSHIFIVGLILTVISFSLLLIVRRSDLNNESGFSFICFIIAAAYATYSLIHYFMHKKEVDYKANHFLLVLTLFSISCFSLNLEFQVFSQFVLWSSIVLILFHASLLAHLYRQYIPDFVKPFNYLMIGTGSTLALFYAIFMLPLWGIGIIGMIVFGITIHLYIPFILFIVAIVLFIKAKKKLIENIAFYLGVSIPLIAVLIMLYWNNRIADIIHDKSAEILTEQTSDLPDWVNISQEIPDNYFTERILKSGLLYEDDILRWDWDIRSSFNEDKKNDPVIGMFSLIADKLNITREDRENILKTSFNARHQARRKLWSGEDLNTSEILTNVRIYPDYRIAYTEKIISIKNNSIWSFNQQEALYSFKLPEGSTATSLSLWINGKEEKSRLSSRKMADSAYLTIVGRERRDPSILHWQEGNIVTVAIFPCTPDEQRRFKVGFTSPMKFENNKLAYQPAFISGPERKKCRQTVLIRIVNKKALSTEGLENFTMKSPNEYTYSGKHLEELTFSIDATELSTESFAFDHESYKLSTIEYQIKEMDVRYVCLDINKNWSKTEIETVVELCADKKVYVYDDQFFQIDQASQAEIARNLQKRNYSLFPFHSIEDINHTLVITKSDYVSPNVEELRKSEFGKKLTNYVFDQQSKILLFDLGENLSPYLETLKQFDCFHYLNGDVADIKELLDSKQFEVIKEKANTVYIPLAGMQISKDSGSAITSGGSDHLMRLYAYNSIIQQAGRAYFGEIDSLTASLVPIAEKAFVTSPVSSLIVLETIADYERFGIDENKNSLGNASANSSGAVPEPHEWVLIILALSVVLYTSYRKKLQWLILRK